MTTTRKGWINVPITETIRLQNDVVVAVEWVDAWAPSRTLEEGGSYQFTLSLAPHAGLHYRRETPEEPLVLTPCDRCPSIYLECVAVKP